MFMLYVLDGLEETIIGDPEADQALAEFDFLAEENKSDISDNDLQNKDQGRMLLIYKLQLFVNVLFTKKSDNLSS